MKVSLRGSRAQPRRARNGRLRLKPDFRRPGEGPKLTKPAMTRVAGTGVLARSASRFPSSGSRCARRRRSLPSRPMSFRLIPRVSSSSLWSMTSSQLPSALGGRRSEAATPSPPGAESSNNGSEGVGGVASGGERGRDPLYEHCGVCCERAQRAVRHRRTQHTPRRVRVGPAASRKRPPRTRPSAQHKTLVTQLRRGFAAERS